MLMEFMGWDGSGDERLALPLAVGSRTITICGWLCPLGAPLQ